MSKNKKLKYKCYCGKMKSPLAMGPIVGTCRYCLTECDTLIKKQKGNEWTYLLMTFAYTEMLEVK